MNEVVIALLKEKYLEKVFQPAEKDTKEKGASLCYRTPERPRS